MFNIPYMPYIELVADSATPAIHPDVYVMFIPMIGYIHLPSGSVYLSGLLFLFS